MGNILCSKSLENIKIITNECISLKDSIHLLQKQLEEVNKLR